GNFAYAARIVEVFIDAKVGIETEGLCEVSDARPCVARRRLQDFDLAASGRHHTADDAKGGGFSGAICTDESKDLSGPHLERNGVHSLDGRIVLAERLSVDN